jgi:hypothetical protein
MTTTPMKVMARAAPPTMVSATKVNPTDASGHPMTRNNNSDQVRLRNGVRRMVWPRSRAWSTRSFETMIVRSLPPTCIRTPVSSMAPSIMGQGALWRLRQVDARTTIISGPPCRLSVVGLCPQPST